MSNHSASSTDSGIDELRQRLRRRPKTSQYADDGFFAGRRSDSPPNLLVVPDLPQGDARVCTVPAGMLHHRRARVVFEYSEACRAGIFLALSPDLLNTRGDSRPEIVKVRGPAVVVVREEEVVPVVEQHPLTEVDGREAEQLALVPIAEPPRLKEEAVEQPEKAAKDGRPEPRLSHGHERRHVVLYVVIFLAAKVVEFVARQADTTDDGRLDL